MSTIDPHDAEALKALLNDPQFTWGCGSSAFQVEGGNAERFDRSVWDRFCRTPGKTRNGESGDISCDFVHRFPEDIALMAELGLNAYRFSIAWPRIFPDGRGKVDNRGLDFYDQLVDAFLAAGIDPWVCLHHWDLPLWADVLDGWRHPDSPQWFTELAVAVAGRVGDRVRHWLTFNEPQCFVNDGYHTGIHAPGYQWPWDEVKKVARNVMLAHGHAVRAIRTHATEAQIGLAMVGVVTIPSAHTELEQARSRSFNVPDGKCWSAAYWLDPMILGCPPESAAVPTLTDDDLGIIAEPMDFLGLNYYSGDRMGATPAGEPTTQVSWPVRPEGIYWMAKFYADRYPSLPIYVLENGMAGLDWPDIDGRVQDPARVDFIRRHLISLNRAKEEGIDVRGYFHWTFTDNFEWHLGYSTRFGLVHVDYETQKRTPKASFDFLRGLLANRSAAG